MSEPANPNAPLAPLMLSSEQVTAMRESWIASGHDPVRFDRAVAGQPKAPPTETSTPAAGTEVEIENLSPHLKQPSLQGGEVNALFQEWCRLGLDPAKFARAAEADGFELAGEETTPAQDEHAAAFGFDRRYRPEEYKIAYHENVLARSVNPAALAEFNRGATEALSAINIDPALGAALVERAMAAGQTFAKMTHAGRELFLRESKITVERQLGDVSVDEAVKLVARLLTMTGPDGTVSLWARQLMKSHAVDDPFVFLTLHNHARLLNLFHDTYPK